MSKINLAIQPLPDGRYNDVTIYRAYGRTGRLATFVKLSNGKIHVTGRGPLYLASSIGVNDDVRRTYARLAGIPWADLKAAVAAERIRMVEEAEQDKLNDLRESAARHGYRLVRTRG